MTALFSHRHGGVDHYPGVLDFSVSISPIFPLASSRCIDRENMQAYPSIDGRGIQEFYRRRFGLEQDSVIALNGAIEGIYLLPRAIPLKSMLLLSPSFYDYGRAAGIAGVETGFIGLDAGNAFALPSFSELAAVLSCHDAFFAGNPNNPTGTLFSPELVMALASRFPDKWFFVDEAFLQFLPGFEELTLMNHSRAFRNIVVVHSLTKFYAVPGLRLGALIAHPDTIRRLYDYKEPWTVNACAESAARELAGCRVYEDTLVSLISGERARISKALSEMPGLQGAGGAANFFLVQCCGGSLDGLLAHLHSYGIHVRDCRNFKGLEDGFFRFSVRTPEENGFLLEALRAFSFAQTDG
ncbi:MAG: pyridoxal phosphate-dependent class II aminotransferase [Chlorobiaceae bacterium]|nr:pyridoxal phosphate-dependent class II aminotransferase [Chlorobiaceae bacterium]NTV61793.1 pyridoxal phosphate-dependent class II aminotransferase [Chlorobiaceae bacterium]